VAEASLRGNVLLQIILQLATKLVAVLLEHFSGNEGEMVILVLYLLLPLEILDHSVTLLLLVVEEKEFIFECVHRANLVLFNCVHFLLHFLHLLSFLLELALTGELLDV